jgi:hypothetical protein
MVEAMELKLPHRGPLQWHHLHTKFHPNPPIGSEVIGARRHTDRQIPFHFWKVG